MESGFLSELQYDFLPGGRNIVLLYPLFYYDEKLDLLIKAPVGFISDGASIPEELWDITGSPFQYPVLPAAVIHDYLCRFYVTSRYNADKIFYNAMLINGTEPEKALLFYLAVRGYSTIFA